MSPSRRVSVIGILVGSICLSCGALAFTIPLLLGRAALSQSLDFTLRHEMLKNSIISWLIGAPAGFVFGAFGALVLFLSLVIYFDTKHKNGL